MDNEYPKSFRYHVVFKDGTTREMIVVWYSRLRSGPSIPEQLGTELDAKVSRVDAIY